MNSTASTPAPVDYSRKWFVMIAVVAGILLATIDASIVNVAFPTLAATFGADFYILQWVSLAYLLTVCTLTLGVGRLGDVVGKRKLYAIGFGIFTVASGLCGIAPTVEWLIGFRVLQAVGSAMILALGSAILVEGFPPNERGKALGWVGSAVSLGVIAGPVFGGVIISAFDWRPIFLVNIPIGIVGTWLAVRYVPKTPPIGSQKFDFPGTILMSLGLFSLSLALTLGQDLGFTSPTILAVFGAAAVAAVVFVIVELKVEQPALELRMFRNPALSVSVLTGYLSFVCLSATFLLMPFYLQGVLGYDVGVVGLLLGGAPLVMGLLSPYMGSLSDRVGIRRLTLTGLVFLAASFAVLLTFQTDSPATLYLAHAALLGVGMGFFQSPNNSAIMGSIPAEYMGVGGGIMTMTRLFGAITGIAVLGSIWATRVASATGGVLPEGGATSASPAAQVAGLHFTFTVAVGVMLVSIVIGAWGLRNERQTIRGSAPIPS